MVECRMDASVEIHPSMKQDMVVMGKTVLPEAVSQLISPVNFDALLVNIIPLFSHSWGSCKVHKGVNRRSRGSGPRSTAGKWCCCFFRMSFLGRCERVVERFVCLEESAFWYITALWEYLWHKRLCYQEICRLNSICVC